MLHQQTLLVTWNQLERLTVTTKSKSCGLLAHISFVQYRSCPPSSLKPCGTGVDWLLSCEKGVTARCGVVVPAAGTDVDEDVRE